jgi:hypothetical protein
MGRPIVAGARFASVACPSWVKPDWKTDGRRNYFGPQSYLIADVGSGACKTGPIYMVVAGRWPVWEGHYEWMGKQSLRG